MHAPDIAAHPDGDGSIGEPVVAATLPAAETPSVPIDHSDAPVDSTLPEPVLVELRFGQLAVRTVQSYRIRDDVLLPLTQFLEMAGIHATLSPVGRLEGTVQPDNLSLRIDAAGDTALLGGRRVPVARDLIVHQERELYLSAAVLGKLLDLDILVNWPDLEVTVLDPSRLPVALDLRRRNARAALGRGIEAVSVERIPARGRRWDGLVVDYSWSMPGSDPFRGSSYAVSAGTNFFGGSLEVGASSIGAIGANNTRLDASWLGVWRDNPWLKQLRLGDGIATGPRPRTMRGVSVSNAPFVRPSLLGTIPYSGTLPPGWQVEAYHGGELIAFDSVVGGDFDVSLPVSYGENSIDFVAYGPFGESRRFNRTYLAASGLLPARRFEYGVSAGQCRSAVCNATANVDVRYGLSRRWTVQGGAERYWRDTLPGLVHPYAGVIGSLTNAMSVHAEAVDHAMIRTGINYEPSLDLRLSADYTGYDTGVPMPLLTPPGTSSQVGLFAFVRPDRRKEGWYFEGRADRTAGSAGTVDGARVGMSTETGGVRLSPFIRMERRARVSVPIETRSFWGFNSSIAPGPRWGSLRQFFIRTGFEAEKLAPAAVSLSIARSLVPRVRLEVGVDWRRGFGGPTLNLQLSSYLNAIRSYTSAIAPVGQPASLNQLVQGSVVYNRASGRFNFSADPSLQRSGVAGRVFLDRNGNGRYDPDEPLVPSVRVQVGGYSAVSDSSGVYQLWDIVPFEPVMVTLDSLSFESPLWVPAQAVTRVLPAPNSYTSLDIPIVVGGVIEGSVTRDVGGGRQGVSGVALTIRNRETGEQRSITTFSDGSFYALGVKPGDYDLAVEPRVLDLLAVSAESQHFTVSAEGEMQPGTLDVVLVAGGELLAEHRH